MYLDIKIGWYNFSVLYEREDRDVIEKIKKMFPFKESRKRRKYLMKIVSLPVNDGLEIKLNKFASLFLLGNTSELYWKESRAFPTIYTALYIFSVYVHLKNNSLIIHGAGIRIKGNGYIFAGASGSGKTTIAQKFYPKNLLNDEAITIKCIKGKFYLKETPFGTLFSDTKGALRLKAVFLPKPSKKTSLKKVKSQHSIPMLLANIPFLYYFKHKLRKNSFILISEMCQKVPVFRAELTLTSDIKKIIKKVSKKVSAKKVSE